MITKAVLKRYMGKKGLNGSSEKCTIKSRCHTNIFKFPRVVVKAGTDISSILIDKEKESKVAVVSDPQSYFQKHSLFRHCSISSLFRWGLQEAIKKETSKSDMGDGTCFAIDQKYYEGGVSGKTVIVTGKASDGTWPKGEDNVNQFINTVLAAIKIEQNRKDPIEEIFSTYWFLDIDERTICPIPEAEASAKVCVISPPIDDKKLKEKSDRLQKLIQGIEADIQADKQKRKKITSLVVNALGLWKVKDDYYRRALYLGLYHGIEKKLKNHDLKTGDSRLNPFKAKHGSYRIRIAHPDMSEKIKRERLNDLQTDIMEELGCIYL